jgi:hypothetical protein
MIDYDTTSRLRSAHDHADRLASDMRHSRPPGLDDAGSTGRARLGSALAVRVGRLRRRRHAPAYQA